MSFFPPKSWLEVIKINVQDVSCSSSLHLCTEKNTHPQGRAMNYFPYLTVFSSLRSNQNLFRLNLKLLFTSVLTVVQITSDVSFLHKDPSTSSKVQYNFQNPFDLEETQPCIPNTPGAEHLTVARHCLLHLSILAHCGGIHNLLFTSSHCC